MMTLMSGLMFRVKDYGPPQYEVLWRCSKFFNFAVPKPYKQDLPGLMKSKEFLSTAKDRMFSVLSSTINKANNMTDTMLANQP